MRCQAALSPIWMSGEAIRNSNYNHTEHCEHSFDKKVVELGLDVVNVQIQRKIVGVRMLTDGIWSCTGRLETEP